MESPPFLDCLVYGDSLATRNSQRYPGHVFLAADNAIIVVAADSIRRVYAFVEADICAVAYARVGLSYTDCMY